MTHAPDQPILRFGLGWFAFAVVCVFSMVLTYCWLIDVPTSPWNGFASTIAPFELLKDQRDATIERFRIRLTGYEHHLDTLNTNLRLQGVLAVLSLAVALSRKEEHEVSGLKTGVPRKLLLALIPLTLMFLWLQFGYLLNHLIDARMTLFHLALTLAPERTPPIGDEAVASSKLASLMSAVNDGGFLDAWFRAFLPDYIRGTPTTTLGVVGNAIALFLVYGSLLGGSHAAMLFSLWKGSNDKQNLGLARAYWFALIVFGGLLVATHIQFLFAGRNPNWQHVGIGFFAVIFLWLARVIDASGSTAEDPSCTISSLAV